MILTRIQILAPRNRETAVDWKHLCIKTVLPNQLFYHCSYLITFLSFIGQQPLLSWYTPLTKKTVHFLNPFVPKRAFRNTNITNIIRLASFY